MHTIHPKGNFSGKNILYRYILTDKKDFSPYKSLFPEQCATCEQKRKMCPYIAHIRFGHSADIPAAPYVGVLHFSMPRYIINIYSKSPGRPLAARGRF